MLLNNWTARLGGINLAETGHGEGWRLHTRLAGTENGLIDGYSVVRIYLPRDDRPPRLAVSPRRW